MPKNFWCFLSMVFGVGMLIGIGRDHVGDLERVRYLAVVTVAERGSCFVWGDVEGVFDGAAVAGTCVVHFRGKKA